MISSFTRIVSSGVMSPTGSRVVSPTCVVAVPGELVLVGPGVTLVVAPGATVLVMEPEAVLQVPGTSVVVKARVEAALAESEGAPALVAPLPRAVEGVNICDSSTFGGCGGSRGCDTWVC